MVHGSMLTLGNGNGPDPALCRFSKISDGTVEVLRSKPNVRYNSNHFLLSDYFLTYRLMPMSLLQKRNDPGNPFTGLASVPHHKKDRGRYIRA
jgi:hypothetical protein